MNNSAQKCGYVAIIGRPNVGKSTLLNALIGQKVSIVTAKPQTTRHQIIGIDTSGSTQIVYIDTPGLHRVEKRAMNRYMNRLANAVLQDVDVLIFVIEASRFTEEDEFVFQKLEEIKVPVILVMNKIDLLKDKSKLLSLISKFSERYPFAHIIPLSAKKDDNINALKKTIKNMMPEGPHLFPDDQITDKNERFQVAEIIREKLISSTQQELPYSTTVVIESMTDNKKLLEINAVIWVEREGQKPIVIGKDGERLKRIGTLARKEIVKLLNKKVFLRLWVKVKNDWTDSERALGSLGYE